MKIINYPVRLAIVLSCLVFSTAAFADVKIKTRQTVSGQTTESTTFIKGKRQRSEQSAGEAQIINLTQCDLKRSVQIIPQSQAYIINNWQPAENTAPSVATSQTQTKSEKGGIVTTVYTTKDTGERKQMFGYTARHLIITMETEASPEACNQQKSKMQFDGWYIDATFALNCETEQYKNYQPPQQKQSGCRDRYEMKQIGTAKRGYPVYEKTIMFDESGRESYSMVNEIVELSNSTLEAGLFDVPAGYHEVKDQQELYASMSRQSASGPAERQNYGNSNSPQNSALAQNIKNMSNGNSTPSAEVGEKKAGVIRFGLANVKTGSVGEGLSAADLSAAVQNTLTEYLKMPNVEVVNLEAKLPGAIDDEAGRKECDFVIYANVSHKKSGGGFGFGKMLGQVVSQTGIGHTGSTAGNIAGQVATQSIVAATLTPSVKAKDELTLDIKLSKNGAAILTKQFKAKAKGDGDDIITQVVEQAAQAIVSAAK